jgi:hypothetical protein
MHRSALPPVFSEDTIEEPDALASPNTDAADEGAAQASDDSEIENPERSELRAILGAESGDGRGILDERTVTQAVTSDSPRARELLAVLRGDLRRQVLASPGAAAPDDTQSLAHPMPQLLGRLPEGIEGDAALRVAADRARAELLRTHVRTAILLGDVGAMKALDTQLALREREPYVKRMLLQFIALEPEPILVSWAELHLYGQ